jgi:ADP-heptose:LPS heptosyltransferase
MNKRDALDLANLNSRMKILIIKPSSLGDVIHSLRVVSVMRKKLDGAQIHWVIRKGLEQIIEASGIIDRHFLFERGEGARKFLKLGGALRAERYDYVLDLQGLLRSSALGFLSRCKRRYGRADGREFSTFFHEGLGPPSRKSRMHAIERLTPFLEPFDIDSGGDRMSLSFPAAITNESIEAVRQSGSPQVILFPESRRPEKVWPHFLDLAEKISSSGLAEVVVCGNEHGPEWPGTIDLRGQIALNELPKLVEQATLVVSNDSAPLHLASAMNKPVVGLFGPTEHQRYGPYPAQEKQSVAISSGGSSMESLRVDEVFDRIKEMAAL